MMIKKDNCHNPKWMTMKAEHRDSEKNTLSELVSWTDTTVLNPAISQEAEGGQIHLNDVSRTM